MGTIGMRIFAVAAGLLLSIGIPHFAATSAHADKGPGCECDCPCGDDHVCPEGAGADCGDCPGDHGKMHGKDCMHRHGKGMAGGPAMKEGMTRHMEAMRGTIAKLRALEAKMESLKSKDDAAAFRAASLEHSKLMTDLQESHLKHMESMMGK